MLRPSFFCTVLLSLIGSLSHTYADGLQDNDPAQVRRVPKRGIAVSPDQRRRLETKLDELSLLITKIGQLRKARVVPPADIDARLPDIEIFHRAVHDALKHQEFFQPGEITTAMRLLTIGKQRATQLLAELEQVRQMNSRTVFAGKIGPLTPWLQGGRDRLVVRGFRSRIDDSVQPYGLVLPKNFSADRTYRLDVWLHGRNENVSENVFLHQRQNQIGTFAPDDTIVLHPYGRYSNAFKFAGEVDVLEAIEHVQQNYHVDPDRISMRGFSMGGAGCWQFAVHFADRWFAANPGAGFSETPQFLKFFQKETLTPTWYERKLWQWYDCNLWAKNLNHCPTIAYSGELDIQKQAADVMADAMKEQGIDLVHLIGPKSGHKYHPDSARDVELRMRSLARFGRPQLPQQIDLVTYTLKYNRMHWITVDSLEEHWHRSTVAASIEGDSHIRLTTQNVEALTINIPAGGWPQRIDRAVRISVNGNEATQSPVSSDRSLTVSLAKRDGKWDIAPMGSSPQLRKRHNLQGPIDDAFMDSFIFVRPTGPATHAPIHAWANAELSRAVQHWRRHFRGDARIKDDTDISEDDIQSSHLILWGEPSSNQMIGKIADKMPIHWQNEFIQVGEQSYDAEHCALIAIYPNPLNPSRYIVLNSCFTFREYAYLNNARQVAKLPDWAIVDTRTPPDTLWPGKIVNANFFDETWNLK